jgi:hypothetical protein
MNLLPYQLRIVPMPADLSRTYPKQSLVLALAKS